MTVVMNCTTMTAMVKRVAFQNLLRMLLAALDASAGRVPFCRRKVALTQPQIETQDTHLDEEQSEVIEDLDHVDSLSLSSAFSALDLPLSYSPV